MLLMTSIAVTGIVSYQISASKSEESLRIAAKQKLLSQNLLINESVSEYFEKISSQMKTLSISVATQEASKAFIETFPNYLSQRGEFSNIQQERLSTYYESDYAERYNELNEQALSNPGMLLSDLDNNAKALQHDFIAAPNFPLGEKDKVVRLDNQSDYARVHARYHEMYRKFLQEFGYYDIFIVDANSSKVVYSVYKELDYATSLLSGPYQKSGLAEAFKMAQQSSSVDDVFFTEFAEYLPSYDALAGFASSPIFVDNRVVAVLIFQMPMDHLNNMMTHNQAWEERGFGESGETYLVADNGKLLTESRFFLEDPQAYQTILKQTYPTQARQIGLRSTSVGIQPVQSKSATQALAGRSGFELVKDYRNVDVFSAYSAISIGGSNIAVLAEIDVAEALAPAQELKLSLITSAIILMVGLGIAGALVVFLKVRSVVKPLDNLGDVFEELTQGEADLTKQISESKMPEIDRISVGFNLFISQIRDIIAQIQSSGSTLASASLQLKTVTTQSNSLTRQQSEQLSEISNSMRELSGSINEISRSTIETNDKGSEVKMSLNENMLRTQEAVHKIRNLVELISKSGQVITGLKSEVNQISTVLNVITSIAEQTNLLALNAAIEAARAGDAGRGFSVVADEVRALATRSQASTVEISQLVEVMNDSSQCSVENMEQAEVVAQDGIQQVNLVTNAMTELSVTLDAVLALSESVASAAEQQNAVSNSVTNNIHAVSSMSKEVNNGVHHTSQAAEELSAIAVQVDSLLARFKV
jgi:methyl-accepting chemotaxis protein